MENVDIAFIVTVVMSFSTRKAAFSRTKLILLLLPQHNNSPFFVISLLFVLLLKNTAEIFTRNIKENGVW